MADCKFHKTTKIACDCDGGENCCWERALAIRKFKKRVLGKYIFEVLFDVVVSVLSVLTDIISFALYLKKGRWVLAIITAIPVLLPTIVFTNVYLADETQGYCKLPLHQRARNARSRELANELEEDDSKAGSTSSIFTQPKSTTSKETPLQQFNSNMDFHCGTCHMLCTSCSGCFGGILRSICHKNEEMRNSGAEMVRKSFKRLLKYLFGTFVLRYIALSWYLRAFMFGMKAYKDPKTYINIPLPSTYWSYDLLVKLDFLQAALENAPQCVLQLYVLLVYPDESVLLGLTTLFFSFMDFVRVSVSVQWDVHKGPVIAPVGCYGSLSWKLINVSSWVLLYIGRSAALALVIATAHNRTWPTLIPIVIILFHVILFIRVFSKAKFGVAAQKLIVSVFISIFFLPEFDSYELPVLTQFYYAVAHIENLLFLVPWNGMEYNYCTQIYRLGKIPPVRPSPRDGDELLLKSNYSATVVVHDDVQEATDNSCLIDPTIIIIAVPVLTMIGIVARLAASKRMSKFKKSIPPRNDRMEMEERIANIYAQKWTSQSFKSLYIAFMKMLRTEIPQNDLHSESEGIKTKPLFIISPSVEKEVELGISPGTNPVDGYCCVSTYRTKRSMSVDDYGLIYRGQRSSKWSYERDEKRGHLLKVIDVPPNRSKSQNDLRADGNRDEMQKNCQIHLIKIESSNGPYLTEMTWI